MDEDKEIKGSFIMRGTEMYLIQSIETELGIDSGNAQDIFYYLIQHQEMLSPQEGISKAEPQEKFGGFGLTFLNDEYYINVKTATIVLCALLLDSKLPVGFMSAFAALLGLSGQAVIKLDEREGEKCIVKETLRLPSKKGNGNILKPYHGECCNMDMKCRFQVGGNCTCMAENIEAVYRRLAEKKMFCREENGQYRYCW